MTGLRLHTTGTGPAVLWVHGYTMDATTWRPLWERLPGWRHVGVDLPGHGGSPPLAPGRTLPDLAADVAAVARAEGADRIVALSFGSSVALQMAIDRPATVSRLVLGAPTVAGRGFETGIDRRYEELAAVRRIGRAGGLADVNTHLTELWMRSPPDIFAGTLKTPSVRTALREVILRHRWDELDTGAMRSLNGHLQTDADLGRITAATLVVHGTEDMPTYVANAEILRHAVPKSHQLCLPGAGHLCLLERPDDVAEAIDEHLR